MRQILTALALSVLLSGCVTTTQVDPTPKKEPEEAAQINVQLGAEYLRQGKLELAQQKLEELRALTWGFDTQGLPIADTTTDTAANPSRPTGGTGLSSSPSGSLDENTSGFVDYVDRFGDKLGGGAAPPAGALYTRRWSIQPLPQDPGNGLIIQVLVKRTAVATGLVRPGRLLADARLVTVRTRNSR